MGDTPSLRSPSFRPLAMPPPGTEMQGTLASKKSARRLQLPKRDKIDIEYFECETKGEKRCGLQEEFAELKGKIVNDTIKEKQCKGALTAALTKGFGLTGVQECEDRARGQVEFKGCRSQYCDMYEKIVMDVTNGTDKYLGGGLDCGSLLHFNRTICEAYYRDAWVGVTAFAHL